LGLEAKAVLATLMVLVILSVIPLIMPSSSRLRIDQRDPEA